MSLVLTGLTKDFATCGRRAIYRSKLNVEASLVLGPNGAVKPRQSE